MTPLKRTQPSATMPGSLIFKSSGAAQNRRWVPIAVAAASCLVPGRVVGGLVVGGASIGTSKEDVPVTVASGTLGASAGGPDPKTTGTARLERTKWPVCARSGCKGLRNPDGFYEVWMMNPTTSGVSRDWNV